MSENNYTISPATSADLTSLSRLLCNTKLTLVINRVLWDDWPNEVLQLSKCKRAIEGSLQNPSAQNLKVVDNVSGETIGHLTLTARKLSAENVKQPAADEKPAPEPGMNAEVIEAVSNAVKTLGAERDDEHLELTHIYVVPTHRHQGIGSQLIQLAIEKAKKDALPLFFDATPAVHEFFLKSGFKDTKSFEIELSGWAPPYSGFGAFRLFGMAGGDLV